MSSFINSEHNACTNTANNFYTPFPKRERDGQSGEERQRDRERKIERRSRQWTREERDKQRQKLTDRLTKNSGVTNLYQARLSFSLYSYQTDCSD